MATGLYDKTLKMSILDLKEEYYKCEDDQIVKKQFLKKLIKKKLEEEKINKQKELNNKKNTFFSIIAKDMKEDLDEIYSRITSLQDFINVNDWKGAKDALVNLNKFNTQTKSYLRNLI